MDTTVWIVSPLDLHATCVMSFCCAQMRVHPKNTKMVSGDPFGKRNHNLGQGMFMCFLSNRRCHCRLHLTQLAAKCLKQSYWVCWYHDTIAAISGFKRANHRSAREKPVHRHTNWTWISYNKHISTLTSKTTHDEDCSTFLCHVQTISETARRNKAKGKQKWKPFLDYST